MRKSTGLTMLLSLALSVPAFAQSQTKPADPQTSPKKPASAAPKAKSAKTPQMASAAAPPPVPVSAATAQPGVPPAPPVAPPPVPASNPAAATPAVPATPEAPPAPPLPYSAPKPGHPLDPADVDTLTGKNKQNQYSGAYVDPYAYGAYGYGYYPRSRFTTPGGYGSRFTTPDGHYHDGFFLFGGTGRFPLLFPRSHGRGSRGGFAFF